MTKYLEKQLNGKRRTGKKQDTVMFLMELSEKELTLAKT
jgi:hypothetical protein